MNTKNTFFKLDSLLFLMILTIGVNSITPMSVRAQNFCQIEESDRSLTSDPVVDLEQKIDRAKQSLNIEGEVKRIMWAEGIQSYEIKDDLSHESFGPLADLLSVQSSSNEIIPTPEKIGSHYKVGNSPVWEFAESRLMGKEVTKIEGAGENDVSWLVVTTDREGYYVLRLETRGGLPPDENCEFAGLLGIPYQTIYVIIGPQG